MTTNTDNKVKYFSCLDAPENPFTGEATEGWYWKDAQGNWTGPAPHGEDEALFHATRPGRIR